MNRWALRCGGLRKGFTLMELLIVMVILAILAGIVIISVGGVIGTGDVVDLPLCMISTTLYPDGTSGHHFFRASWNRSGMTPEELASLDDSASRIKNDMESNFDASVVVIEDPVKDKLIIHATVDFKNPNQIEGILAVLYGQTYFNGDISIDVQGPFVTEFEKAWFITMSVNPSCLPCVGNLTWEVNVPGVLADINVIPSDANVTSDDRDSNTIDVIFEPQNKFVSVSIKSEESKFAETVMWPLIVGVVLCVVGVVSGLFVPMSAFLFRRYRRRRVNRRQVS